MFGYTDEAKRLFALLKDPHAAVTPDMHSRAEYMGRPQLFDENFSNEDTGYLLIGSDEAIILKVNDYVEYNSIHDNKRRYMYVSGFSL